MNFQLCFSAGAGLLEEWDGSREAATSDDDPRGGRRRPDRSDDRGPLSDRGNGRVGRHGSRLRRGPVAPRSPRRHQGAARRARARRRVPPALHAGSGGHFQADPPEHGHALRLRRARRHLLHRHGAPEGPHALGRGPAGGSALAGARDPHRPAGLQEPFRGPPQGRIPPDLKAANVMLLSQRHELDFAKVLDFGLVKFFTDGVDGHTHQGTFVGTPHYVSPEQARDEQPDPRSDVYSLGILLYLMLTGHVPFHAASAVEVLVKQLNEQPVPPRERRPDLNIDPQLEALVLRCLAKQRDERVRSMDELLAALTQVRSHIVPQARSVARGPDPLTGVSPPGLLNPTPPAAGIRARGTPIASISNRIPNSTPRPISNRVPHSIPPTPALVQKAPAVATKRGPAIALGAAVVVAVALVGTALFVRSHRAPVAAPAAAPSRPRLTMEIDLDGRRPAPAVETPPAAAEPAPAVPVQVAPAENKTAPQTPEPPKESAKRRPARPVAPAPKEPEKALAVVP